MGYHNPYFYGYTLYTRKDALVVKGPYYTEVNASYQSGSFSSNTTKYFYGYYINDDGSSVKHPLALMNYQSNNSATFGFMDMSAIQSGGRVPVKTGNFVAYVHDANRKGGTTNPGGGSWFESIYLDWNSWSSASGINRWEVWYRESTDNANWSGRVLVKGWSGSGTSGNYRIGSVNQTTSSSDWGGRGYYYQWCVVGCSPDGYYSNTSFWSASRRKCTVSAHTFNANGGKGAPATQYKPISYNFVFPSAPSTPKTGHHFVGWNSSASASDGYAAGTNTSNVPDSPVTWYAIWKPNTYKMTVYHKKYNVQTGQWDHFNTTYDYATYGSTYTPPYSKTPTGYHNHQRDYDGGWKVTSDGGFSVYYYPDSYYLDPYGILDGKRYYDVNKYGTYDVYVNGTCVANDVNSFCKQYLYGSTYEIKDIKANTGYTYEGVVTGDVSGYPEGEGSSMPTTGFGLSGTINQTKWVHLKFSTNTYTVKYDANGGSGTMSNSTVTYNSAFQTRQNTFTRTGYSFNGWNEKADGTGTKWGLTNNGVYESGKTWKWAYDKNITLYAQWTPNTYTVTFDANGGYTTPTTVASKTFTYNNSYKFPGAIYAKPGYVQIGWNSKADGTGTNYSLAQTGTWTVPSNLTVYAKWRAATTEEQKIYLYNNGYCEAINFAKTSDWYGFKKGVVGAKDFTIGSPATSPSHTMQFKGMIVKNLT